MRGIDISRLYFEKYGLPMLESEFDDLLPYLAIGFVGKGSERFGFDDEISRDHDFEPGFSIFIPGEDIIDSRTAFRLERAYLRLPKEFMGINRQLLAPVGGNRNGIIRTADFYKTLVGSADGSLSQIEWLKIPLHLLAEATNGEVFLDNYGQFTEIRNALLEMPDEIRLKRLSWNILHMARFGQYDFTRSIAHEEYEAAQLSVDEFVKFTLKVLFLLKGRYPPYYRWSFKALREFNPSIAEWLSSLLKGDNSDRWISHTKTELIDRISSYVVKSLKDQGLSDSDRIELAIHADEVNKKIKDATLRNMNFTSSL